MTLLTEDDLLDLCRAIAAPLSIWHTTPDGSVKMLFVSPQEDAAKLRWRLLKVRQQIELRQPIGVQVLLFQRVHTLQQIEAFGSVARLAGTEEVLRQCFGIEPDGEWA